jgi:hypothetical protein
MTGWIQRFGFRVLVAFWVVVGTTLLGGAEAGLVSAFSGSGSGMPAAMAADGDRFCVTNAWAGSSWTNRWSWQIEFPEPRFVGSILQIHGDHEFVLRHAPRDYAWEASDDGQLWRPLVGAAQANDRRLFRLHRLARAEKVRFLRLHIRSAHSDFPVLREVEFYAETNAVVSFPDWIVAVNVTHDATLPGHGQEFIPLAKSCDATLPAQQVWLTDFSGDFLTAEPRPLGAFLSGSFADWCEVNREHWRGVQEVLRGKKLPLWASCGGAQGLALVSEYGVEQPWDCPHCRDPRNPKTPLYTHIGHAAGVALACGKYDHCVFERGPFAVRRVGDDPAFAGLPEEFTVMESHCGQIAWAPKGWELIATAGPSGLTKTQCLRFGGFPIHAAQFHLEMAGTPEVSRRIMGNFLEEARHWRDRAGSVLGPKRN